MQLTKASKLALYGLVEMALSPTERISAARVAGRFGASENHVAKVLQQVTRCGLAVSTRGVGGGYQLARPAAEITMAEVVRCIEGELKQGACEDCPFRLEQERCGEDPVACSIHRLLNELNSHVYYTLESVTIETLARSKDRSPLGL